MNVLSGFLHEKLKRIYIIGYIEYTEKNIYYWIYWIYWKEYILLDILNIFNNAFDNIILRSLLYLASTILLPNYIWLSFIKFI